MAVTVSTPSNAQTVMGDLRVSVRDVTFDSSYPTGGETLNPSSFGLSTIHFAISSIKTAGTGSVTEVFYDIANKKLKAYAAAAEISNTTDLSAVSAQVVAFGK